MAVRFMAAISRMASSSRLKPATTVVVLQRTTAERHVRLARLHLQLAKTSSALHAGDMSEANASLAASGRTLATWITSRTTALGRVDCVRLALTRPLRNLPHRQ